MVKSTKSQLKLFRDNFDDKAFENIKLSVIKAIKSSDSLQSLFDGLKSIHGVQCVEFAEDDDLENEDFEPGYKETEEDSCDFLVIMCYAELEANVPNKAKYVEVCFYIVYNDITRACWIDAVSLSKSNNPKRNMTGICFLDLDTHEPVVWCRDLNKGN